MKRYILTLVAALTAMVSASAMSYERAREEALYLTDKMAYELNLNDQQYNDAYEINLDYFLSMNSERDLYKDYLSYRLTDFRHILVSWQFDLMLQADYFVRPLLWSRGCWVFPIYTHYHRHVFYYDRPRVYFEYRGGHGHHHFHNGYYAERRPRWDGGMRGREPMYGPDRGGNRPDRGETRPNPSRGDGYHFDLPGRGDRNTGRGNESVRGDNSYTPSRGGQPGRGTVTTYPSRGEQPGRGTVTTYPSRGEQTARGDYDRGNTRGGYSIGRNNGQTTRGESYSRSERNNYTRQYQNNGTHGTDRSYSTPSRSTGSMTRSGNSSQPASRGNSFSRSSSRAVPNGGSSVGGSRGASVSRGSSSAPTRGASVGSGSRGGASGGGTVSRGRR